MSDYVAKLEAQLKSLQESSAMLVNASNRMRESLEELRKENDRLRALIGVTEIETALKGVTGI
jgi:cell shape-determining protein MreC